MTLAAIRFNGHRLDGEFLKDLWNGDALSIGTIGVIIAVVFGMFVAQRFFGWKILDKRARRRAHERRHVVLWKYERD